MRHQKGDRAGAISLAPRSARVAVGQRVFGLRIEAGDASRLNLGNGGVNLGKPLQQPGGDDEHIPLGGRELALQDVGDPRVAGSHLLPECASAGSSDSKQ